MTFVCTVLTDVIYLLSLCDKRQTSDGYFDSKVNIACFFCFFPFFLVLCDGLAGYLSVIIVVSTVSANFNSCVQNQTFDLLAFAIFTDMFNVVMSCV